MVKSKLSGPYYGQSATGWFWFVFRPGFEDVPVTFWKKLHIRIYAIIRPWEKALEEYIKFPPLQAGIILFLGDKDCEKISINAYHQLGIAEGAVENNL